MKTKVKSQKGKGLQLLLILFSVSIMQVVMAQDTIVKRNDEKIVAKILEVNPADVKYKRFDYPDGPVFTSAKWELKYIIYGNGVKESFENFPTPPPVTANTINLNDLLIQPTRNNYYYRNQKIAEQDMLDLAWKTKDKKVCLMVKKTEEQKITKNVFMIGGIVLGSAGVLTFTGIVSAYTNVASTSTMGKRGSRNQARMQRQQTGGYLMLAGLGCEAVSIVFKIRETRHAHFVVDLYNKTVLAK